MLTLLSPAKKLLSISKPYPKETSNPLLLDKALQLVKIMKSKSVEQIADLMDLSRQLSELNYERYQDFDLKNNPMNHSYPALFLFQGDVYQGLNATSWKDEEIEYAQSHLGILSGLYGFLRPLDRIQPYRLEMGVNLENPAGRTLYAFWSETVTNTLNQILAKQNNPILINLASTEYFKVVDEKKLSYPIVTINFYEQKNSELKMIGILAKKVRGIMAKYIMQNRIDSLEQIKEFSESGYLFDKETSNPNCLNFIRIH
ncbi:TPA: peroxide stress protein YaaA [Legionella pneumophila subsp. raphaeli]|uniref:peroxide stress protein YaaA n=1 Tax=Legionella pneumophila TaxID=446 RepID=UPI00078684BF|nr:peroxide stress protein YaaA [Legionella pneumophila]HCO4737882.1 peroxide stress protein YaaA [Legionella pneumophila]HDU7928380.1 peroxide stress protein YaaA [Legionella pneumophila]HDU7934511.1 peroxide stress protein YaaA [Legionella pneumophila]HDU7963865.1 peroxide stress protein YaaA [Legionella pneumophila]HEG4428358.1 peroxide stress protein YaaA [Legionella pneumophila]